MSVSVGECECEGPPTCRPGLEIILSGQALSGVRVLGVGVKVNLGVKLAVRVAMRGWG